MYHSAITSAWVTPHALTWPIIHCLAYLLQFKTFRTFNRHDPKLDLINIKSQQRNHSLTVAKHFGLSRKIHPLSQILFIKTRTHPGCNTQAQMDFSLIRRATEGFARPSYSDALNTQAERQLLLGRKKKNDLATKPISNVGFGV